MGISRQEYWSGLPFPPPRDLPDPGIEPRSPALQADSLLSGPPGTFPRPAPLLYITKMWCQHDKFWASVALWWMSMISFSIQSIFFSFPVFKKTLPFIFITGKYQQSCIWKSDASNSSFLNFSLLTQNQWMSLFCKKKFFFLLEIQSGDTKHKWWQTCEHDFQKKTGAF